MLLLSILSINLEAWLKPPLMQWPERVASFGRS